MQFLKQSTVASVIVGPCLDSLGVEYTGLLITDLNISKNGGTPAAITSGALTHVANGWYTLDFATGNVGTLGRLDVTITKAGYQIPPRSFTVLAGATFDAIITNAAGTAGGMFLADVTLADTGVTLNKALEMLVAFINGKLSASSTGGISTVTYKKRDGSTTSFTAFCADADGQRATTGALS